MMHTFRQSTTIFIALFSVIAAFATISKAEKLEFKKGDNVVFVGNALGERMQHQNFFETYLHQAHADKNLTVRNLCFPGDEPQFRLRSLNFGDPDLHLTHSKADVIFFFFGFNESFAGKAGLPQFKSDLKKLLEHTAKQNYSGKGTPRVVLISPIAFEAGKDRNRSDGKMQNMHLQMYTNTMGEVAKAHKVPFVDLFAPSKAMFAATNEKLTYSGAHLTKQGYKQLAAPFITALTGEKPNEFNEKLHTEVTDKNFHWWHRYRAVNGYSIYGTRGLAGKDGTGTYNNRDVMERERQILDQMCANRDQRIWKTASGESVTGSVDDSNTLPFIKVVTNVGGPDDVNRKRGKLGSLDYKPAAEQQKLFKLADGYEIQLVASEEQFPELANPVSMNFDNKGRLWVSTMPSYPQWKPKTKVNDKLLILEDDNGDGTMDRCKVFADGLHQPTGFEIGFGGVWVAEQPDVLFLTDENNDDKEDNRVRRLVGFDTADSHHGLSAFEWGPGGGLYFNEGTFKQSQVESPYGLSRMGDAGTWRFDPRTGKFSGFVSLAFANPWGHVFDKWGQNFIADASPGFNYWAAPISGHVAYPDKHPGGARANNLDFGGSVIRRDYPRFIKKRIRPSSGCEIVSSENFPPEAQGNFLVNNVIGELTILQHKVFDEGSGFGGEEIEPLVSCKDGNFRPVDLQFGPDGALYIVDWHNALIGHLQHNLRDPSRDKSHGRIWKIFYKDRPLTKPPVIADAKTADLFKLLESPVDRTRYRTRREIAQRKTDEVIPALEKWLASVDKQSFQSRLEGLWVYQTHNTINIELLTELLTCNDFHARAAATRVLSFWTDQIPNALELLKPRIADDHPRVRLEAARACSFIHSKESFSLALDVLRKPMDGYIDYTLEESLRAVETAVSTPTTSMKMEEGHDHGSDSNHTHDHAAMNKTSAPLIMLDKPKSIVDYQIRRLSNPKLLATHRMPNDPKYRPLYDAIIKRAGIGKKARQAALVAIAGDAKDGLTVAAIESIKELDNSKPDFRDTFSELAEIVLTQPAENLTAASSHFQNVANNESDALKPLGFAGMAMNGRFTTVKDKPASLAQLNAIPLIPSPEIRNELREITVLSLNNSKGNQIKRAAITALASMTTGKSKNFAIVAKQISNQPTRNAAVKTLLSITPEFATAEIATMVVNELITFAKSTPTAKRTRNDFLDAMQLADSLLVKIDREQATKLRGELRRVSVQVVKLNTVHEEMRYDKTYFVVEAGRNAQLVLHNDDLMPHNLVMVKPGKMVEIALIAADMPPVKGKRAKQYVPKSPDVLFATGLIEPHKQEIINFKAPKKPGEYPYVCTFPGHYTRMYGVMVVVEDIQKWLDNPRTPKDPLGSNRKFVQSWKLDDLSGKLDSGLKGRSKAIGKKLFTEANCAQCHVHSGEGGKIGPELTNVLEKWKGDRKAILNEIINPSAQIDEKYSTYNVYLFSGQIVTGLVTEQNASSVTIISNPDKPEPKVIPRSDIEELEKAETSLMPKGVLNQFTEDEIFEILSYVIGESK